MNARTGTTRTVMLAGFRDLSRNRWIAAYALAMFAVTEGLFWFGGTGPQVALSLLNISLIVVPLVCLVFGAVHIYASRDFIELLLAQPISRARLFAGLYLGLALPLAAAFVAATSVAFALHVRPSQPIGVYVTLIISGAMLSLISTAFATLIALLSDDRLKGVGLALGAWLLTTFIYDGVVLAITATFAAWPLERPMLAMMLLNPIDLARVIVLTRLDASAMMGYTGAVFTHAFGTLTGVAIAGLALLLWCVVPVALATHRFNKRDF